MASKRISHKRLVKIALKAKLRGSEYAKAKRQYSSPVSVKEGASC